MTVNVYITARRAYPDALDYPSADESDLYRWLDIMDVCLGIRQYDPWGDDHIYRLK